MIVSSTLKEREALYIKGHPIQYAPDVAFAYTTGGARRTSGHFSRDPEAYWSFQRIRAEALKNQYPDGKVVEAFVCPSDPAFAVLVASLDWHRRSHLTATFISGLLVLAAFAGGVYISVAGT